MSSSSDAANPNERCEWIASDRKQDHPAFCESAKNLNDLFNHDPDAYEMNVIDATQRHMATLRRSIKKNGKFFFLP